jgi:hypothetical protein
MNGVLDGPELVGALMKRTYPEPLVSKYRLKQAEGIHLVRERREQGNQFLGFNSRPFVLCGLPLRGRRGYSPKAERDWNEYYCWPEDRKRVDKTRESTFRFRTSDTRPHSLAFSRRTSNRVLPTKASQLPGGR